MLILKVSSVVSYRNSTSNHNRNTTNQSNIGLYLIEILHQTTTCLCSSCFALRLYLIEILHQTTTGLVSMKKDLALYLIEILHQTTTLAAAKNADAQLYLIEILHQTTTQPRDHVVENRVVSYRNSTSNHNFGYNRG